MKIGLIYANMILLKLKFIKMKTKLLSIAAVLLFGIAVSAQETQTIKQEVKKDAKAVGNAVEDGVKWTGETAVKGAEATKEGVKDGAKWTETTAKKGAKATKKGVKKGAKWTEKTAKKGGKAVKEGYKDTKEFVKKETK